MWFVCINGQGCLNCTKKNNDLDKYNDLVVVCYI